jgi:hypothetical protein
VRDEHRGSAGEGIAMLRRKKVPRRATELHGSTLVEHGVTRASPGRVFVALLLLSGLALAARGIAVWRYGPSTLQFGDAGSYLEAAATLCAHGSYQWRSNLPFFRPPGLPLLIAIVTACDPGRVVAVKVALASLDAGTVALTFTIARGLGLSAGRALVASSLVAVHPLLIQASTEVTSEPLALFLISGWLAAVVRAARKTSRFGLLLCVMAGIAGSLAALTRPAALLCLPLGVAGLALRSGRSRQGLALRIGAFSVGAVLTLAPWSILASRASGGLIIVNDALGYNLWRGTHPDLARAARSRDVDVFVRENVRFDLETSPQSAAEVERRATSLADRSREWLRLALINVRAHPLDTAGFAARKVRAYWRPWPDRSVSPTWLVLVSGLLLVPLFLAASIGFGQLARCRRRDAWFLGACLALPWLTQLPFQVASRFRLPFCEVILCVLAAGIARRGRSSSWSPGGADHDPVGPRGHRAGCTSGSVLVQRSRCAGLSSDRPGDADTRCDSLIPSDREDVVLSAAAVARW